jgi:hypothetical protein
MANSTKPQNLIGKRFGRLIVLEQAPNRGSKRYWLCKCDCGKEHTAAGFMLKRDSTRSCGCYKVEMHSLPGSEGSFNSFHSEYISNAKRRNYVFSLTKEQFRKIADSNCSYCGAEPKPYYSKNRANEVTPYLCNGVDRIDNSIGYAKGNCTSCCSLCNLMKRGLPVEDFKKHVQKISVHLGRS